MHGRLTLVLALIIIGATLTVSAFAAEAQKKMTQEDILRAIVAEVPPLTHVRGNRIPLRGSRLEAWIPDDDAEALEFLTALDDRGIGLSPRWNPAKLDDSIAESLRMARLQTQLGLPVSVHSSRCIYSFFNGDEGTFHVAEYGSTFFDDSFSSRKMGCPFRLEHRKQEIKDKFKPFLEAYKQAGIDIDFMYVDWEIDGPIEFNGAWEASKRCTVCRENVPDLDDFMVYQRALREIRSDLQRECYAEVVRAVFPDILVGNYSVNPHNGWRYWYDYYEKLPEGAPYKLDQLEKYRPWYHEFDECGYTFANPVCYTWYETWSWYPNFDNDDYRWFYNLLKVGTNACRNTAPDVPVIPWVHWHTTAQPADTPPVPQMTEWAHKEFLWHLYLRGADSLMMWCTAEETVKEVQMMNEVMGASLEYREFLTDGEPVFFSIPRRPATVVSGIRLGDRLLVRRTDFGDYTGPVTRRLGDIEVEIPSRPGQCQVINLP